MLPAEVVIEAFRGVRKTAEALNIAPSSVCRWKSVPPSLILRLLKAAAERGINLECEQIMVGNPDLIRSVKRGGETPRAQVADENAGNRFDSMVALLGK